MGVLFDIDSAGSRQAQLGAGVLDGLGDEDVAPADGVVVRRRAARVRQLDVDDDDERVLVDAPPARESFRRRAARAEQALRTTSGPTSCVQL